MEDRIAALESKVAELEAAADDAEMRCVALKTAFIKSCGPLVAAMGVTPDRLRDIRDEMSVAAAWLTFLNVAPELSDRRGDVLSREFDDIFTRLMREIEANQAAKPPEPLDRFEAMADHVSSAGVQLSETQRLRLAQILQGGIKKLANAEAASDLKWLLTMCDLHAESAKTPEDKARFEGMAHYMRQRIAALT